MELKRRSIKGSTHPGPIFKQFSRKAITPLFHENVQNDLPFHIFKKVNFTKMAHTTILHRPGQLYASYLSKLIFQISNLNSYWQISNFQEIAPNFAYSQISYLFNYDWNFLDQLLLPNKFDEKNTLFQFFIVVSR